MNNKITIRYSAAHHSVTAGDVTIDFCKAHRDVKYQTRRTIIEGLKQRGYFTSDALRKSREAPRPPKENDKQTRRKSRG